MNKVHLHHPQDHEPMCESHHRFCDDVGDAAMRLQDAAYSLGHMRGQAECKEASDADAKLLKRALRALEHYKEQTRPIAMADEVMEALRARLAPAGEPAERDTKTLDLFSDQEGGKEA